MTVLITYPHAHQVSNIFSHSLVKTVYRNRDLIYDIVPVRCYVDSLYEGRNKAFDRFLNSGAEWLWTLDTDIGFLPSTLPLLLEHGTDYKVISGLYRTVIEQHGDAFGSPSSTSVEPAAYLTTETDYVPIEPARPLVVDAVGAGCLLVHRSVAEKLPADPWNHLEPGVGEDFSFCYRVKELGEQILVDPTIKLVHQKMTWI